MHNLANHLKYTACQASVSLIKCSIENIHYSQAINHVIVLKKYISPEPP